MIYLLCDFAFVPITHKRWDKVLNKWKLNSGVDAIGKDRFGIIDEMQHLQKFINSRDEKSNLEF